MSTSTLGLVQLEAGPEPEVTSGQAPPTCQLAAFPAGRSCASSQLRRLNLPDAADTSDTWRVTTSSGQGWLDRHSGALLAWQDATGAQWLYDWAMLLHTGERLAPGLWCWASQAPACCCSGPRACSSGAGHRGAGTSRTTARWRKPMR